MDKHLLSIRPLTGLLSEPTFVPDSLEPSWQRVHGLLVACDWEACTPPQCLGLAVYHYSVYKAFGQEKDAELARCLLGQFAQRLVLPYHGLLAGHLDQFCQLAWLHTRLSTQGFWLSQVQTLLVDLDDVLRQEALQLRQQQTALSRSSFFRIMRYFGLRLPGATASGYLRELLALNNWPLAGSGSTASFIGTGPDQFPLGLGDGLAAELLVLIQLSKAGLPEHGIELRVREGIRHLLAYKHNVDFMAQQYSVFPYQVHRQSGETTFSAELSWRRGDVGQALLLYQAHKLLQDAELAKIAELVGLNTLLRTTTESTGIASSQLRQGAAGVAHLYHKLYQASGQRPEYHRGRLFWLGQTQSWLHQELATGFYHHCEGDLQDGLVGVGLVLLAAITNVALDWDATVL